MAKKKNEGRNSDDDGGKKTTVSPGGLIKKTFWFQPDEVQMLRKESYEREISQAALVRAAVRKYFGMSEPTDPDPGGDLTNDLRSDPEFRQELRTFLGEHTEDANHIDELMNALEGRETGAVAGIEDER